MRDAVTAASMMGAFLFGASFFLLLGMNGQPVMALCAAGAAYGAQACDSYSNLGVKVPGAVSLVLWFVSVAASFYGFLQIAF